jgi:hypothetical protein
MWIRRTPEEIAQWHESTSRELRSKGVVLAVVIWGLAVVVVGGGWFVSLRTGIVARHATFGRLGIRMLIAGTLALPVSWYICRRGTTNAIAKARRRTICPDCDTMSEGNEGTACPCGGSFVPIYTVKWIDDDELNQEQA